MAHIRKLDSGRYQVQIRIKGLKLISKTFKLKKNASNFANKVEANNELALKLGNPIETIPISITFNELADLYMEQYQGNDPSTVGRLQFWCKRFGSKNVIHINDGDVDDGLWDIADRYTGSTVNRYKNTLSATFSYFMGHHDYKRKLQNMKFTNPVLSKFVSKFTENPAKERFLDEKEQKSLLNACRTKKAWDKLYLLVLMALTTGARKGEMLNLKWSDIDFKRRVAILPKDKTKNKKTRLLPLTHPVIQELMKFRANRNCLIFHSTISKFSPFDVKKQWKNALELSNIFECRFHDLRHTAASNLVKAGRSLFEVGKLLGHSSTQMTERYAHLAVGETQNMVDDVMGGLS